MGSAGEHEDAHSRHEGGCSDGDRVAPATRPERNQRGGEDRQRDQHVRPEAETDAKHEAGDGSDPDSAAGTERSRRQQPCEEQCREQERGLRVVAKPAEHVELERREDESQGPDHRKRTTDKEPEQTEERRARYRIKHRKEWHEGIPGNLVEPPKAALRSQGDSDGRWQSCSAPAGESG